MKKFLLPMIAAFVMLSGCSEKAAVYTSYFTVHNDQWLQISDTETDGQYFYSKWEAPELNDDVIMNGAVVVYLISNGKDNVLPFTEYQIGTDEFGNTVFYQERLEYYLEPGYITFKFKSSDFNSATSMSTIGELKFKMCVINNR